MITAILVLIGDLALGGAAYKLSKSNSAGLTMLSAILKNHEDRITALEKTDA